MSPLLILMLDGELWWIFMTLCPIVGEAKAEELEELKEKVKTQMIDKIEPYITPKIKEEFLQIADAINSFENHIEGIDYVRVAKFR